MAVVRNQATIQSRHNLYPFLSSNFTSPVEGGGGTELRQRIFFYVGPDEINRKGRQFSEVPGNRKVHCVKANDENIKLLTNTRSCYCCKCRYGEFEQCMNKDYMDDCREIQIEMLTQPSDETTRSE